MTEKKDFGTVLQLLENATQNDLQLIQDQIAFIEKDMRDYVAPRERQVASLKRLHKLIETRVVPKEKKPRDSSARNGGLGSALQQQIFDLLSQEGSMPLPAIAARLGKTVPMVSMSISRINWFERRNGEVHIAVKGPQ